MVDSLIEIAGEDGLNLAVRLQAGRQGDAGATQFEGALEWSGSLVGSWFVLVAREDLYEWQEVLDLLDGGESANWSPSGRTLNLVFEKEGDREGWWVRILDPGHPYIRIGMYFYPDDEWFDHAYNQLEKLLEY